MICTSKESLLVKTWENINTPKSPQGLFFTFNKSDKTANLLKDITNTDFIV